MLLRPHQRAPLPLSPSNFCDLTKGSRFSSRLPYNKLLRHHRTHAAPPIVTSSFISRSKPSKMLQSKSFVKKTRQGRVVKVVREHYLRDDIYCGAPSCKTCDTSAARLSTSASTVLIVDTNVVLNQVGVVVSRVESYVRSLGKPDLLDLVVPSSSAGVSMEDVEDLRPSKKKVIYSEVLLIENDINTRPFSSQVLACLPPLPWSLSSEDLANANREDLRHLRVFSVDPPGPKHHCESLLALSDIADVTNFVLPGAVERHPSPTKEMLEPLLQTAAAVGLDLDVSSSKALADSLDRAVAVYFSSGDLSPSEFSHYGLAARLYTHFTSPIRRYADRSLRIGPIEDRFGIEGPVYLVPKGDKGADWVVDEAHQRATKAGTSITYGILQTVRIHMEVVEPQPNRPELQLTVI
ncbi:hypothetical protein BHE74_00000681 [Ensete ventricosum]|nr:hypothetical protein GW17_00001922 [Ensete ventricosum]RWW90168.1 hypothetical protein BHE74_00000681 [Ensete ventricosum]RZR77110.1 hypothetical protein BHM03_00002099 [Ensete ventricosum]